MRLRIKEELALITEVHRDVEHVEEGGEDWFYLPHYPTPQGWQVGNTIAKEIAISFLIKADYPSQCPYGFLTPEALNFNGTKPNNIGAPPKPVPFTGGWIHFSWTVENWVAESDVRKGSNLVVWCRSFNVRLKEGV